MLWLKQKISLKSAPRKSLKLSNNRYLTALISIKLAFASTWKIISSYGMLDLSSILFINNLVSATLMGKHADNVTSKRNSCRKPNFLTKHNLIKQYEIQFSKRHVCPMLSAIKVKVTQTTKMTDFVKDESVCMKSGSHYI